MKSLILFRHGKSDWDAPYDSDRDRPLAARGREAARCMGRLLAKNGHVPDIAISSPAKRAIDTLHLAVQAGRWHCPVHIEPLLYETPAREIVNWLRAIEGSPRLLLLVGHEPTWSDLAKTLIGGGALRVPTGAMVRIDCDIEDWSDLHSGQGELRWLLPPKSVCPLAHRHPGRQHEEH